MNLSRIKVFLHHEFGGFDLKYHIARIIAAPLPDYYCSAIRTHILRLFGFSIGPDSIFWGMPRIIGGPGLTKRLIIGCDTRFNIGCVFDLYGKVTIGDHVSFGPQVMVLTGDHELGTQKRRNGALAQKGVNIGNGCWIGARATILPGVTIGNSSVIAAGSVVNRDVPPNTIVGGVPARTIRRLESEADLALLANPIQYNGENG
jgi:maltose O-acetyltransferase